MATAAVPNTTQGHQAELYTTARAVLIGLVWGAVMLCVFGFWMRIKYEGPARAVSTVLLGAAALAAILAIWQGFTIWFKKETPEQKTATLEQQKNLFSYVFLGAGLALILFAFYLGLGKKPSGSIGFILDNFAESFGTLLFGLIALCGGYILQRPTGDKGITVQFLVEKVQLIKMSQLAIAALCLGTIIYVVYNHRATYASYLPELGLLLALSVLAITCFLYLNTSGLMDEFGLRLFVLIFGGVAGMLLFLWSLWRTIVWRDDILLGGVSAWQGDNAWRFWLCAYVLFFSLILMFLSFNLAKADIRTNVVLRRVMYGYDTVAQGLLVIGILYVLNVVVYALVPYTFDWTKSRGLYDLAQSSKKLISGLKTEVNFIVLIPQGSGTYKDVRVLLDNCQALSNKLHVKYVSPDADPLQYRQLVKRFPVMMPDPRTGATGRGVLIVNGPMPTTDDHKVASSFVPDRKLVEVDRQAAMQGGTNKNIFKGEGELLKELKFLQQDRTKRKIYVLQGNGEPAIHNMGQGVRMEFRQGFDIVGMGIFVDRLKSDNYDVQGLSFNLPLAGPKAPELVYAKEEGADKRKNVPEDCHTLIVAGVSRELGKEVVDALDRYMDRGGKMLVFLDVHVSSDWSKLKDTGLEPLLKRYGVEVTNQFALRLMQGGPRDDPEKLYARTPLDSENPLAKAFAERTIVLMDSARILKPSQAGRFKAETILALEPEPQWLTISESNTKVLQESQRFVFELMQDRAKVLAALNKEPVPVGLAVTDNDGNKPRMVVFGDTEFISNRDIVPREGSEGSRERYAFVVSAMEWMAEKEGMGDRPKESPSFGLPPGAPLGRMIFFPGWLMLLTLVSLGACVWVVRRR